MISDRVARWSGSLVLAALIPLAAVRVAAQMPPGAQGAEAFTIRSIKPQIKDHSVLVEFTRPLVADKSRSSLHLIPPLPSFNAYVAGGGGEQTLVVKGEFRHGTRYTLKFSPGFASADHLPYTETIREFEYPHKPPALRFAGVGSVVERLSRQLVHFEVTNVDSTLLETVGLAPLAALEVQSVKRWEDALAAAGRATVALRGAIPAGHPLSRFLGEAASRRDLFDTKGGPDEETTFSIPLSQRPEKVRGAILLARLRDNAVGADAQSEPAVLTVTDLGLTCLAGNAETLVWVTSLQTGLPVAGVEIAGLTRDRIFFAAGRTDKDGVLRIPAGAKEGFRSTGQPAFEVHPAVGSAERYVLDAIAAAAGDDVAVQRVPSSAAGAVVFPGIRQVAGVVEAPRPANAAVFTERGAYRPGETVHVKGTVRRWRDGAIEPPGDGACRFEVTDARGRSIQTLEARLSAFGTAAVDVALPASAPLGEYQLVMRYGEGARLFTTVTFRVEEFVPPRHFARVRLETSRRTDDSYVGRPVEMTFLKVVVEGGYYAGGPVKNGRVRWQLAYGPSARVEKGFDGYVFGHEVTEEERGAPLESGESFLDADGRLALEFPVSQEALLGERTLEVSATVLDFDGRSAATTQSWRADTGCRIGIAAHPAQIGSGERQRLSAILVDREGALVRKGVLGAEVLHRSWSYYRKRNLAGNEYWVSQRVWKRSHATEVPIRDGAAVFEVSFERGGEFLVRFTLRDGGAVVCSSAKRYQVGWESWDEGPPEAQPYTRVSLSADQPRYRPGQRARLQVGTRQRAAAWLFTVERHGIVSYRVLRPKDTLGELEFVITEAHAPNVYASVVGTVPRGAFPVYAGRIDEGVPTFLHGVINLPVVQKASVLAVAIAPGVAGALETEPGREVSIPFAVRGEGGRGMRAELAVAVVDEAVLALTGYKTPELSGITRFDVPLGMFLADLRTALIAQTPFKKVRNEALTGGGEGEGPGAPLETRRDFQPVAYWNPALVTDEGGGAEVRFTLPDQMSSFRVFVVACDTGSAFGSAERQLRVAKPFYLEPGLPRFFTKGDSFRFSVAAFNQTAEAGAMTFTLAREGGLELAVERGSYPLKARDLFEVPVSGRATATGPAKVRFAGAFGARRDAVEIALPVRSGHVRSQETWYATVRGEAAIAPSLPAGALALAADPALLAETSAVLTLSGSPFLRMTEGLRYLLQYPYGCVEQTSSGVLPLAALRNLLKNGLVPGIEAGETDPFLIRGVERLLTMQTDSGGFGYWPGNREASPWGTFYAAAALAEARDAGIAVPEDALNRLANYLRHDRLDKPPEQAGSEMAMFLLARLGRAEPGWFAQLPGRLDRLAWEPRILALLAASEGGRTSRQELAPAVRAAIAAPRDSTPYHYGFHGALRRDAMALLLLDRVLPGDPAGEALAAKLLEARGRSGHWERTSDAGWALAALGRHFTAEADTGRSHIVMVRPATGEPRTFEFPARGSVDVPIPAADFLAAPRIDLASDPAREVLASVRLVFPRVDYAAQGGDAGFHLAKRVENADGSAAIRVGDLVKVTLEFTAPKERSDFVVLEDPLPAGLVAINAAFSTEQALPADNDAAAGRDRGDVDEWSEYWSPDGYYRFVPDHLEIREDRVAAFRGSVWGWGQQAYRFVYYARAVCEGEFVVPSTKIERMYEPAVNGYTRRTTLTIGGRAP